MKEEERRWRRRERKDTISALPLHLEHFASKCLKVFDEPIRYCTDVS